MQVVKDVLDNYFCCEIRELIKKIPDPKFFTGIQEIRLRVNKPIIIKNNTANWTLTENKSLSSDILSGHIITKKNLDQTLELITNYSVF